MSCFPESTYAVFVDDELTGDERRAVRAHLVQCRRCRGLVVALEEEGRLLADVLHERERRSFRAAPRTAPPPRELALGVLPTLGLGVVALAVLGWIFEAQLPKGAGWLNPFRLEGAFEMVFDVMFAVRDQVPGLLEFLVSVAALGSVALLLLLLVSALSRRLGGTTVAFGVVLATLVAAPAPGRALDLRFHEDEVAVRAGETVAETMIVNAETVRVDGIIDGDLIVVLAERLILRGEVRGNVFCSARTVEVSGRIAGNLHAIGEKVRVDGEIGRNLYSVSELVTLADDGRVGRDATHVAAGATLEGRVGRDAFVLGEWVELRGTVARNLDTRIERASLLDGARVGGDFDAMVWEDEENVEIAPGAVVAGEVRTKLSETRHDTWYDHFGRASFYAFLVIRLCAAFVVGMLLHWLVPRLFDVHLATAGDLARTLGVGFLVAVATPFALVLIAITLLGIPLALIGLVGFLVSLYLSFILIAALIGTQVTGQRGEGWRPFALALLAGLAVLAVGSAIPFLGTPLRIIVMLTGLGLLVERLHAAWRAAHAAPAI
jgi:hypothetical protein